MTKKQDLAWWQKTIAYEIYPKSFYDTAAQGTGTIAGITAKLDYLASLGVGAIWITPCYKSPMVDNGYDVEDYRQIDPSFGTMEDMDQLIAEGNEKGVQLALHLRWQRLAMVRGAPAVLPAHLRSAAAGPQLGEPGGAPRAHRHRQLLGRQGRRRLPHRRHHLHQEAACVCRWPGRRRGRHVCDPCRHGQHRGHPRLPA